MGLGIIAFLLLGAALLLLAAMRFPRFRVFAAWCLAVAIRPERYEQESVAHEIVLALKRWLIGTVSLRSHAFRDHPLCSVGPPTDGPRRGEIDGELLPTTDTQIADRREAAVLPYLHRDWQDGMRFGPLDPVLLWYAAQTTRLDSLVVNHLDELPDEPVLCRRYQDAEDLQAGASLHEQQRLTERLGSVRPQIESVTRQQLLDELATIAPLVIQSEGPTYRDRRVVDSRLLPKSGEYVYGTCAERL